MPAKKPLRKGLPKKKKTQTTTLFDFLNDITWDKKNILNKDNKHAYSPYMMTKWISMYEAYLPLADYLNQQQMYLDEYSFHKLCIAIVPKKRVRFNYIKGAPDINTCKRELKYIRDYFQVSEKEAYDYYCIAGDELVENIKKMYGIV